MKYFYKQNRYLENLIGKYFEKLNQYNNMYFDGELSLILLGSLSRGEATWIETGNGYSLISDIEYFTVYPDSFCEFDKFTDLCKQAQEEIFQGQTSNLFHIDNTFVKRTRLSKMERKLITFDAKCMGKTVVGKDYIHLLPKITIDNMNLFDIKDILTHRVFYVLYYGEKMDFKEKNTEYRYLLAKNSLDLMTVILVNDKKLVSGFVNRLEIIKELNIDDSWKKYFEYCLCIKLGKTSDEHYTVFEMENIFIEIIKSLKKEFKIPLKNIIANKKRVARRCMGILKRTLNTKHIVLGNHLERLINHFENGDALSNKAKRDNYILNGYPEI